LPQTSLNSFKIIQTIPKQYCAVGRPNSLLLSGRPTRARARARALPVPLTGRPCRPLLCRPTCQASLSRSISDRTCAHGARRPPAPRAGCCRRRPPVGSRPHELPRAVWHPHTREPLSPPLFPLPAELPPSAFRRALLCRKPDFSPLLDHSLERSSLPTTPRTQTTTSGHRSPPLPREFRPTSAVVRLPPVSSSPGFLAISSPPRLSRAAGPPQPCRQPLETPHHRRTLPPRDLSSASPSSRRSGERHHRPTCPATPRSPTGALG
jgi:hypothetical protein